MFTFASVFPLTVFRNPGEGHPSIALRGYCIPQGRGPGKFFQILSFMSSKNYTLVAWTESGKLRMVPSLVNIAAEPYKGSDLEDHYLFFTLDDRSK